MKNPFSPELVSEIFGGANPGIFLFWMFLALGAQLVSLYYLDVKPKYKEADGTPSKFSFSFMLRDNLQKIAVSFFFAYVGLRLCPLIFNIDPGIVGALLVGGGSERIADFFRKGENGARK